MPWAKVRRMPAGRIGEQDRVHSELGKGAHRQRGDRRVVSLVEMEPATLGDNVFPAEPARDQFAPMSDHRRLGESPECHGRGSSQSSGSAR